MGGLAEGERASRDESPFAANGRQRSITLPSQPSSSISQSAVMFQRVAAFCSPLFEFARVLVRLDHLARYIVNANHSIMGATAKLRVADCIADCVRLAVPQATKG